MPKLLKTPFAIDAAEGFRTDIQESTGAAPNSATYQVGFPPVTMQSIASNGMPPKGSDLNGVLYDITDNLVFLTQGGGYGFDAAYATSIGGYPLNARLRLTNGDIVKNTIDGNANDPNVDMTGWRNPKAEQDALNATLIKPYNALTTYTDGQLSIKDGVIQKLISGVWKRTEFRVDDFLSVSATAAASNILSTKSFYVPLGTHNIASTIFLAGYHHIRGEGDMSDLLVSPSVTGFEYNATTGAYDDHPNRTIKDVRIRGDGTKSAYLDEKDGTTTGFYVNNSGSRGNIEGVTFDRHDTGLKVQRSYTDIGRYNYYRANKVGLHLDGVTSYREEQIYARYNSTAAVLITGIMQNVTFAGGALEGNRGRGIWVKDLAATPYFHLHLDDLYMEACGDRAAGVPAVDIVSNDWVHVAVKGGSYWSNTQQGISSGAYKWGNSVSFEASTLGYAHYAKKGSVKDGIFSATLNTTADLTQAGLWGLTEPMLLSEFRPTVILNTTSSPVFQVPFKGRPVQKFNLTNTAIQTYPHAVNLPSGTTVSENTSLDYGDGSWTNINFSAAGDYSANYAELFRVVDNLDGSKSHTLHTFLLRPTTDVEIGFDARGGITPVHKSHFKLLANKTYKFMMVSNIDWSGNLFARMFSLSGATSIAYLPIYSAQSGSKQDIINLCNVV